MALAGKNPDDGLARKKRAAELRRQAKAIGKPGLAAEAEKPETPAAFIRRRMAELDHHIQAKPGAKQQKGKT